MPIQDRTSEFRACVESIRNRSSIPARSEAKQRLLQSQGKGHGEKSEFTRMAASIGKEISSTALKLEKLAQRECSNWTFISRYSHNVVAKRKTLFDDRPVEISVCPPFNASVMSLTDVFFSAQELTYIIKQDIAKINKQIASLQAYVKQRNASSSRSPEVKQLEEHNHNVVMLLQSKLADTSMTFKDVLEIRTQVSVISMHLHFRNFYISFYRI